MQGLNSELVKQRELEEASKPDGLIKRKLKRIFGALGDVKTMFF